MNYIIRLEIDVKMPTPHNTNHHELVNVNLTIFLQASTYSFIDNIECINTEL